MFAHTQHCPAPNGTLVPPVVDPRPTFWNEGTCFMSVNRDWNGSGQAGTGWNGAQSGWNGSGQNGHGQAGGLQ